MHTSIKSLLLTLMLFSSSLAAPVPDSPVDPVAEVVNGLIGGGGLPAGLGRRSAVLPPDPSVVDQTLENVDVSPNPKDRRAAGPPAITVGGIAGETHEQLNRAGTPGTKRSALAGPPEISPGGIAAETGEQLNRAGVWSGGRAEEATGTKYESYTTDEDVPSSY